MIRFYVPDDLSRPQSSGLTKRSNINCERYCGQSYSSTSSFFAPLRLCMNLDLTEMDFTQRCNGELQGGRDTLLPH
jgi:hypothetical protein